MTGKKLPQKSKPRKKKLPHERKNGQPITKQNPNGAGRPRSKNYKPKRKIRHHLDRKNKQLITKKNPTAGGRPSTIDEIKTQELENSFRNGFTVDKAIELAEIPNSTYYAKYKNDKQFRGRMDRAKKFVEEAARQVVAIAITDRKHVPTARWYLERKVKDEFGGRTEITGPDGEVLQSDDKELKAIAKGISKLLEDTPQDGRPKTGSKTSSKKDS